MSYANTIKTISLVFSSRLRALFSLWTNFSLICTQFLAFIFALCKILDLFLVKRIKRFHHKYFAQRHRQQEIDTFTSCTNKTQAPHTYRHIQIQRFARAHSFSLAVLFMKNNVVRRCYQRQNNISLCRSFANERC